MRLTRHAKNRVRFIARRVSNISESGVLSALKAGVDLGTDQKGNHRVRLEIAGTVLIVVVDKASEVVVTIWREG